MATGAPQHSLQGVQDLREGIWGGMDPLSSRLDCVHCRFTTDGTNRPFQPPLECWDSSRYFMKEDLSHLPFYSVYLQLRGSMSALLLAVGETRTSITRRTMLRRCEMSVC